MLFKNYLPTNNSQVGSKASKLTYFPVINIFQEPILICKLYNHNSQKNRKKSKNRSENCWFLKVFEITGTDGSLILNCFGRNGTDGSLILNCFGRNETTGSLIARVFIQDPEPAGLSKFKEPHHVVFPVKLRPPNTHSTLASFNTCWLNN